MLETLRSIGSSVIQSVSFRNTPEGIVKYIQDLSTVIYKKVGGDGGEPSPGHFPKEYQEELLEKLKKEPQQKLDQLYEGLSEIRSRISSSPFRSKTNLFALGISGSHFLVLDLLATPHCPYLDGDPLHLCLKQAENEDARFFFSTVLADRLHSGNPVFIADVLWRERIIDNLCRLYCSRDSIPAGKWQQTHRHWQNIIATATALRDKTQLPECHNLSLAQFLSFPDTSLERISKAASEVFQNAPKPRPKPLRLVVTEIPLLPGETVSPFPPL